MNQERKNKLFFVAGVVFGLALLATSVGIIAAQTWAPPTANFPNANVFAPLDTSSSTQSKLGGLVLASDNSAFGAISFPESRNIKSGLNFFILNAGGGAVVNVNNGDFRINATGGLVLPNLLSSISNATGTIYYNTAEKKVKLNTTGTSQGWTDLGGGGGESYWTKVNDGIAYTGPNVFAGLDGEQRVYIPTGNEIKCVGVAPPGGGVLPALPIREAYAAEDCRQYYNARMACDNSSNLADCTQSFYSAASTDSGTKFDQYHKSGDPANTYYYKSFTITNRTVENTTKLAAATLSATKSVCIGTDCRTQWPGPGGLTYATILGEGGICVDHFLAIKYNTDGDKTSFIVSGTNVGGVNFGNNCGAKLSLGSWRYSKSGGAMQADIKCGTSRTVYQLCPWNTVTVKFKKEGSDHFVMASSLVTITSNNILETWTKKSCPQNTWCQLNAEGRSANGNYFSFDNIKDTDSGSATFESSSYVFGPERLNYE